MIYTTLVMLGTLASTRALSYLTPEEVLGQRGNFETWWGRDCKGFNPLLSLEQYSTSQSSYCTCTTWLGDTHPNRCTSLICNGEDIHDEEDDPITASGTTRSEEAKHCEARWVAETVQAGCSDPASRISINSASSFADPWDGVYIRVEAQPTDRRDAFGFTDGGVRTLYAYLPSDKDLPDDNGRAQVWYRQVRYHAGARHGAHLLRLDPVSNRWSLHENALSTTALATIANNDDDSPAAGLITIDGTVATINYPCRVRETKTLDLGNGRTCTVREASTYSAYPGTKLAGGHYLDVRYDVGRGTDNGFSDGLSIYFNRYITPEMCQEICDRDSACKSFDYFARVDANGGCLLRKKSKADAGVDSTFDFDHYQKDVGAGVYTNCVDDKGGLVEFSESSSCEYDFATETFTGRFPHCGTNLCLPRMTTDENDYAFVKRFVLENKCKVFHGYHGNGDGYICNGFSFPVSATENPSGLQQSDACLKECSTTNSGTYGTGSHSFYEVRPY